MEFEQKIKEAIAKAINVKTEEILLEKPKQEFGDYTFPCFSLAKKLGKAPVEIAKEIESKLKARFPDGIEKIHVIGPYINFFIDKKLVLSETINEILKKGKHYGSSLEGKNKTALIEHTSLNPNSSPHMGRVRNAIIGDILARVLKFNGYKTDVHFFVNDVSKQIAFMLLEFKGTENFDDLLGLYIKMNKKLEKDPGIEKKVFDMLKKIEKQDKKIIINLNKLVSIAIKGQQDILGKIGIFYDSFDHESKYLKDNILKNIITRIKNKAKTFEDAEGRLILDQSDVPGLDKQMKKTLLVLTRGSESGKTYLYVVRDIAYHIDKSKEGKNVNVVVLGEDHKLYFQQLAAVLKLLKIPVPRVVHYSFTLIREQDNVKKMSTRKGDVVLLSNFIQEAVKKAEQEIKKRARDEKLDLDFVSKAIAIGAIRYSIARVEIDKNVIFDWHEALNFEGNSSPYLQYSYVRASSILKKIKQFTKETIEIQDKNVKQSIKEDKTRSHRKNKDKKQKHIPISITLKNLDVKEIQNLDAKEYALVKELERFPEIVSTSLKQLKPNLLCNYAYSLSTCFNDFYESCPVLGSLEKKQRILLVMAFKQVMANCLDVLGIPVVEEM
jgi:arginyl-tRNA synthetase